LTPFDPPSLARPAACPSFNWIFPTKCNRTRRGFEESSAFHRPSFTARPVPDGIREKRGTRSKSTSRLHESAVQHLSGARSPQRDSRGDASRRAPFGWCCLPLGPRLSDSTAGCPAPEISLACLTGVPDAVLQQPERSASIGSEPAFADDRSQPGQRVIVHRGAAARAIGGGKGWPHTTEGRSGRRTWASNQPCQRLVVVPGHPVGGMIRDVVVMALERDEVVEGVGAVELRGVDEAHMDVADVRAVQRLVEERVLAAMRRSA
jgi:hypothetical protein